MTANLSDEQPFSTDGAAEAEASARLAARLLDLPIGFCVMLDDGTIRDIGAHGIPPDSLAALVPSLRQAALSGQEHAKIAGHATAMVAPLRAADGTMLGLLGGLDPALRPFGRSAPGDLIGLAGLVAAGEAARRAAIAAEIRAAACRTSERRLHAAIDSLPHQFWVTDAEGRYVVQNSRDRSVSGDLVGRNADEAVEPAKQIDRQIDQRREHHRRVLAGETLRFLSHNPPHRRDTAREVLMTPLNVDGAIVGHVGLTIDRTARAEAEWQLAESDILRQMVIDALRCPLFVRTPGGGEMPDDADPGARADRPAWDDAAGTARQLPPCIREQAARPGTPPAHGDDGRHSESEEIDLPPIQEVETVAAFASLAFEQAARIEPAARLRASEARFRAAIDALPFPLFVCDLEGRPILRNAADRRTAGDTLAMAAERVEVAPELARHMRQALPQLRAGRSVRAQLSFMREGRSVDVEHISAPVYTDGVVSGFVGVVIDHSERGEAERRRRESETRLADYLATASDWLWQTDSEHRFVARPDDMADVPPGTIHGRTRWEIAGADRTSDSVWRRHRAELDARLPFRHFVHSGEAADGSIVWIEASGNPVFDSGGRFMGYRGTARDVSERRRAEAALREAHARLEALSGSGLIGIIAGRGAMIEEANDAFLRMVGRDRSALRGGLDCRLTGPDEPWWRAMDQTADPKPVGSFHSVERDFVRPDGSRVPTLLSIVVLDANERHWFGLVQDLTAIKMAEERVRELAERDILTGLANRHVLYDRLRTDLDERRRPGAFGALLLLDLDHFKEINDTLGHDAGDRLLKTVGKRLKTVLRDSDTIARLGGDEFAIILRSVRGPAAVAEIAQKILAALRVPLDLDGRLVHPDGSIGVSLFPPDGNEVTQLVKKADIALYQAKSKGRGTYCFFEPSLFAALERRREIAEALQRAIARDDFSIALQPKITLATGALAGVEALIRWRVDGVPQAPDSFIGIAEDSGCIVPLGQIVRRRALEAFRAGEQAGLSFGTIAVNVAAAELKQAAFAAELGSLLDTLGVPANRLEIELTENVLLDRDVAAVTATLRQLRHMGVTIALDDFGTGYASLTHLKRFPVDRLKIDKSFVRDIGADSAGAPIIRGIIDLAHTLGMTVVAEGVETEEQRDFLARHGCDFAQGFLFAEPLGTPAFLERLAKQQAMASIKT